MKAIRKNSKVTAFVLTLALLLATSFPVFAADVIEGTSDVTDVTINVILPTNLNFALDPLGLDVTTGSQITAQDYFFVNQTLAPVKVTLDITATATNNTTLISSTGALKKDDTSETSKKIYFGALGATGLTGNTIAATGDAITTTSATDVITTYAAIGDIYGSDDPPTATYATVSAVAPTLVTFTPNSDGTTGSAFVAFALGKAVEAATPGVISALADDNAGVAAFQFYAELNTYADWKANDLAVSGTYTLTPLRGETYANYVATDMVTDSLNQLKPAVTEPETPYGGIPGFIEGDATVTSASAAFTISKASTANYLIPFYFGEETITSMASIVSGTAYTLATTHYAIGTDANADNLILYKDGANGVAYTFDTASTGPKEIHMILSNGTTYKFIANMVN